MLWSKAFNILKPLQGKQRLTALQVALCQHKLFCEIICQFRGGSASPVLGAGGVPAITSKTSCQQDGNQR
jgi:hypothetical protein